jgi:hypothetical protein
MDCQAKEILVVDPICLVYQTQLPNTYEYELQKYSLLQILDIIFVVFEIVLCRCIVISQNIEAVHF